MKQYSLAEIEKRKAFTYSLYVKYYSKNAKEYDDLGDVIIKPSKKKTEGGSPKKPKEQVEKKEKTRKKIETSKGEKKPISKKSEGIKTQGKIPAKKKQQKELGGLFKTIQ